MVTFVHLDDASNLEESITNSTFNEDPNQNMPHVSTPRNIFMQRGLSSSLPSKNKSDTIEFGPSESFNVGHTSHIPRMPPNPTTYSIPSIRNMSVTVEKDSEDLFGMIKLKDTDICYTSGTIEWVGRKRTFPINSGFKVLTNYDSKSEPFQKKLREDNTLLSKNKIKYCDCADVLPTVNAIIDHLNALHEAVDLVDLRLNTLEDVASALR